MKLHKQLMLSISACALSLCLLTACGGSGGDGGNGGSNGGSGTASGYGMNPSVTETEENPTVSSEDETVSLDSVTYKTPIATEGTAMASAVTSKITDSGLTVKYDAEQTTKALTGAKQLFTGTNYSSVLKGALGENEDWDTAEITSLSSDLSQVLADEIVAAKREGRKITSIGYTVIEVTGTEGGKSVTEYGVFYVYTYEAVENEAPDAATRKTLILDAINAVRKDNDLPTLTEAADLDEFAVDYTTPSTSKYGSSERDMDFIPNGYFDADGMYDYYTEYAEYNEWVLNSSYDFIGIYTEEDTDYNEINVSVVIASSDTGSGDADVVVAHQSTSSDITAINSAAGSNISYDTDTIQKASKLAQYAADNIESDTVYESIVAYAKTLGLDEEHYSIFEIKEYYGASSVNSILAQGMENAKEAGYTVTKLGYAVISDSDAEVGDPAIVVFVVDYTE